MIVGARNSRFTANTTDNNDPGANPTFAAGGIVAIDGSVAGGGPSAFLQIDNNHATGNNPFDLNWDGTGNKVVFAKNTCGSSDPGGLC